MIILNNEEQDLDDIPTEEEELNLANILQTTENARVQATKARKKVSILPKKNARFRPDGLSFDELNPIEKILSLTCSFLIGLGILFLGIAIIFNAITGNSSDPMNDFIIGQICIFSGGLVLFLAYLGVVGKVKYTKSYH